MYQLILESGYGYIDVDSLTFTVRQPRVAAAFKWMVSDFADDDVPGLIIDDRGNGGGLDTAAAAMASNFVDEPVFYQDLAAMDDGELVVDREKRTIVEPSGVLFDGPVVVLVDSGALSSAEGIPMVLQRLPRATVIGMEGTGPVFAEGEFDSLFRLPEGLVFSFLERASLDGDGVIQIDSDATGAGGVTPDILVPLTEANARAIFVDGTDVVLQTAVDHLDAQPR